MMGSLYLFGMKQFQTVMGTMQVLRKYFKYSRIRYYQIHPPIMLWFTSDLTYCSQ
jgi:hypothetical protein